MDFADLIRDKTVCDALPKLPTEVKEQPEIILKCLGLAIHQVTHSATVLPSHPIYIGYIISKCLHSVYTTV